MNQPPEDNSTFAALGEDSSAAFGPLGLLLYGYDQDQAGHIAELAAKIAGTTVTTACCTTTMGAWPIAKALHGDDGGTPLALGQAPHIAFMSGLTEAQVGTFLDSFASTGLARPIFAMATPDNLSLTVLQLMQDLMAERAALD